MTNQLTATNQDTELTMSSREIAELTGKRHDHVMRDIEEVLYQAEIDFPKFGEVVRNSQNQKIKIYNLPKRECDLIVSGYSVKYRLKIIDRWHELEAKEQKPMSQLEILAQSAIALVEHEKKLTALEDKTNEQQKQIEDLKESYSILPSKPANAESITYIRKRINDQYGLPARIVNEVLYSIHYAPKPAGQVRNTNENAGNSTYTVWNTSEVTKLFQRFYGECEMATKTMAVHPAIDGRFKLKMSK